MASNSILTSNASSQVIRNTQLLSQSSTRLASGKKQVNAADDVAAVSVGAQLASELIGLRTSLSNLNQGSSLLQVANGGISNIVDLLQQQQALAIQAGNGSLSDTDRGFLDQQFQALSNQINQISGNTNFNGVILLDGSQTTGLNFDTGDGNTLNIALPAADLSTLTGGQTLSIATAPSAQSASAAIGQALAQATSIQAGIGANQSQFNFASENLTNSILNQESARSELNDTDVASESTNFADLLVKQKASISVQAQANKLRSSLLKLVQ